MKKILLNKYKSINSNLNESNLSINLENNFNLLPYGDKINDIININELYRSEINSCNVYHFIFNIEPLCTNILYNPISVIKNCSNDNILNIEQQNAAIFGQSGSTIYNLYYDGNTNYNTIKQTNGYIIYCGLDVFDNHLFRTQSFKIANSLMDKEEASYKHIYMMDDIVPFSDSINNNILEDNGWIGFKNPCKIALYNSGLTSYELVQKRFINGINNGCDFIDMYPTRDLFLFKPKITLEDNGIRNINKNWDYCLTYPSESENNNFLVYDSIFGNGLPLLSFYQIITLTQETICVCKTPYYHNLTVGDSIQISLEIRDTNISIPYAASYNLTVYNVGDENGNDSDHYFMIKGFNDYNKTSFYYIKNGYSGNFGGRVNKVKNGFKSEYYIRKFSRIPSNDINNLNDLAFGSTIYGDKISQIIYNSNIKIDGLIDNRKRPLSEIYLTIIKRNNENETSSCFGNVTSAYNLLDLDDFKENVNYGQKEPINEYINNITVSGYTSYSNIHYIHNIPFTETYSVSDNTSLAPKVQCTDKTYANFDFYFTQSPSPLESNITIDKNEFYGDIVEFVPIEDKEYQLEPIYHRFNTVQRESLEEKDCVLTFNEILMDDYSVDDTPEARQMIDGITTAYTEDLINECDQIDKKFIYRSKITVGPRPEGYYYAPHNKIMIKEFNIDLQQSNYYLYNSLNNITNIRQISFKKNNIYIEFTLLNNLTHIMSTGDTIKIIAKDNISKTIIDNTYVVYTASNDNKSFKIIYEEELYNALTQYIFSVKYYTQDTPIYATDLGDGRCIWHNIMDNDKVNNNIVYSNNVLYVTQNIKLALRRQDPFGKYGLLYTSWPNDLYGEEYISNSNITDKIINEQC